MKEDLVIISYDSTLSFLDLEGVLSDEKGPLVGFNTYLTDCPVYFALIHSNRSQASQRT